MICKTCGKDFERTNSRQVFCSIPCQRRTKATCSRCKDKFFVDTKGQRLCQSCRNAKCKAPGCDLTPANSKVRFKLGYCNPHYLRFSTHGDPLAGNPSPIVLKAIDHKDGTRTCSRCDKRKPLEAFYKDKSATLGRRSYCKECQKKSIADRYLLDPEKKKEYQRDHRIKNLSKVRAADTARYVRDKDKRITLAEAHGHIRRARRVQAPFEPGITRIALRKIHGDNCFYCGVTMMFTRAKNRQFNSNDATIEHRLPLSRGGKHVWANAVLACRECNLSKNLKTEEEFQEYRLKLQGDSPEESESK